MKRCFISVDFPGNIRKEIQKVQDKLPEFMGKKTELENIHLTLKFLGEIDETKLGEVVKRLREIKNEKFKIKINKIGVFSEKFVRIAWVGVDSEEEESKKLWKLQGEIDDKLKNLFGKERRFMGHVTIARVKNLKDKKEFLDKLNKIKPDLEFEVKDFRLKESELKREGPEYSDIEIFNLE